MLDPSSGAAMNSAMARKTRKIVKDPHPAP